MIVAWACGVRPWGLVVFGLVVLVASCAPRPLRRHLSFFCFRPTAGRHLGREASDGSSGLKISASCAIRTTTPVVLVPATRTQPAIVAPPAPSDLIRLLGDPEARVRRRAALALGRVGLRDAVGALTKLLSADPEPEVRQMAAFALGLVGDPSAPPAPCGSCRPGSSGGRPRRRGAGHAAMRADATAVSDMVLRHGAGALASIMPRRSCVSAGAARRGGAAGPLCARPARVGRGAGCGGLDASGRPVSTWWPVAYALQRLADARAHACARRAPQHTGPLYTRLCRTGARRHQGSSAAAALRQIIERRAGDPAVVVQAIRAAAAIQARPRRRFSHALWPTGRPIPRFASRP